MTAWRRDDIVVPTVQRRSLYVDCGDESATHQRTLAAGNDVAQTDESDAELVARVQRGDRAAFDGLVRRYAKRAFSVANRLLQNSADAEDVVQDSFIAAVNAIDSFDPLRPFGPWFMRIVVNKGLTAIRSRAAEAMHVRGSELAENDAVAASTESLSERAEIRERFAAALQLLPRRQQLIVQLADVEGFTSAEIAQQLAIPSGTVRWLLHQARETLRQALAPLRRMDQ
jgi:RNA polymerase sigma-70 factor (ECF subfamily)